jgi:ubiquinone/menaquinone biosynthesis C-methylase UbiE
VDRLDARAVRGRYWVSLVAGADDKLFVLPPLRFTRKPGNLVEIAAGPEQRILTTARSARGIQALATAFPGRFSLRELRRSRRADAATRALVEPLLIDARQATGSLLAGLYEQIGAQLPDARFVFQNHGYAPPEEDFAWLRPEDVHHRYPLNLARHLLAGVALDGSAVLDIGCGRGGTCSYVSRYFQPRMVCGLDFSATCLAFCRRVHQRPRVEFVRGDAAVLPFGGGTFDVLVNLESSHCYPARRLFFAEVHRVLRADGVFCYADVFSQGGPGALGTRAQLVALGFDVRREQDITSAVARALDRGYPDLERLLRPMVSDDRGNRELVESMLDGVRRIPGEDYATGQAVYYAWQLAKKR